MAISVVQHASGTAQFTSGSTTATTTVAFASTITPGNYLLALLFIDDPNGGASFVSAVTTNGTAENWTALVNPGTSGDNPTAWGNANTAGGTKNVIFTVNFQGFTQSTSNSTAITIDVYEVSGVNAADAVGGTFSTTLTGGAWTVSSGTPTTVASEIAFGMVCIIPASASQSTTITGPGAFTNTTQITTSFQSGGTLSTNKFNLIQMAGWEILSGTGTVTYNGTSTRSGDSYGGAVVTLYQKAGSIDVPAIQPGPAWLAQFKPWMPRPRPPVPPSFVSKVDTSGSVAMAPMGIAANVQASPPPMDLPAIKPGPGWLSLFKPGQRPHRPPIAAPPSGPNPANQPNLSDVPQIMPGQQWLDMFKPWMPRPRPQVPSFPSTSNPGALAMAPMGMSGTVTAYPTGSGSAVMAPMAMSGTVHVPVITSGSLAMAPMKYGTTSVHVPVITTGSLAMAPMAVFTPPVNQDVRSLRPGPVWRALFKKPMPSGRPYKIDGGPQFIGVRGGVAMAPMGYASQVIQYLPFPQFPLNLKFEVLINGTWLDITSMVYERDGIQITRGLPDETQSVTPSQMTLTLDNRDGRFSPNNPLGAYFPFLTRNTQLRCSVVNQASANGNPYSGYRFWGEVSSWPPRWDSSQADVYCQIVVSGVLRRYVQGAPLGSTLRQYYTSLTGDFTPGAYWPCEDGNSATEIASAIPGVVAATFTGAPGFASDSSFGGSDALPVIGSSVWHGVTSAAANPPGTGSITQKFPGTYHWTAPPGVAAVTGVQVTGAGGGGGDQNTTIGGGGGGGGGAGKAASVTVTSGTQYTYVVPAGGAAGAGGDGVAGGDGSFTGDSQTVTGKGGSGGRFGGSGGAGGAGPTFNGGTGGAGSAGTTVTRGSEVIGNSGGSGGGADGGQQSASWTAPSGITGTVNIFTQAAGGGGAGGASGASGHGGGGGGGGGNSSGSTNVSAGDSLTFFAGNGGAGGTAAHGGQGGDSGVSDGSVSAGGGSGGSGSGTPGSGGSGNTPGSGGGSGGGPSGGAFGGGGGGGGSGSAPGAGQSGSGRTPGPGGGNGQGGGWGSTSSGNLSSCTTGGTGGAYGGGGGGGGAADNTVGKVGGGGGPGYVQWNWQVSGLPSGGGGGSSAGTAAGGNSGSSGGTGGSAPTGGGAGGNSGQAGTAPGGGGGGGVPDSGSGATVPGAGAPGQVSFSWSGGTTSPVAADIVRFCLHVDSAGAADGAILLQILTYGTIATINVVYHLGGKLELVGINSSSVTVFDSGQIAFSADGTPLYMSVEITASGANATWKLTGIKPGAVAAVATASGTVTGASVGNVSDILVDPSGTVTDSATALGQITYQTYADTLVNLSPIVAGYAGETAAARIARLCASQGIGFELTGNAADTPKMGPQADDTFVGLLQACTDLDRGQMSETRDQFGIGYRTRVSMQGQNPVLTADYTLAVLSGNLAPVADDQFTRNSITVTRTGGASSVAQLASGIMSVQPPPNGVGTYSYSLTVDAFSDSQLANLVAWLLTVGTVSEYRYPSVQFDMARAEVENLFSVIPGLDIGDFVQVINPPFFLQSAPISQLAWGFTETLNAYTWVITINTVPESPYSEGNPPAW